MPAIKTKLKLIELFEKYNKKYWDNKLPSLKIQIEEIKNTYGEYTSPNSEQDDTSSNYSISINARLHWRNQKSLRKTLLHEMCHHAIFVKNKNLFWDKKILWHGKEWKAEMLRVGFKKPITRFS